MNNIWKFLSLEGGNLYLENIDLMRIVKRFGTPIYVYSLSTIRENIYSLIETLSKISNLKIFYAVKSLSHKSVLKFIYECGLGVETVSLGELKKVFNLGFEGDRIIYNGLGKDRAILKNLVRRGVKAINLDSEYEVRIANELGLFKRDSVDIGIRLNLSIAKKVLDTASKTSKFGIEYEILRDLILKYGLDSFGLHCHLGSQIGDLSLWNLYIERIYTIYRSLMDEFGVEVKYIDLGGGIPKDYLWSPIDIDVSDIDKELFSPSISLEDVGNSILKLRRGVGNKTPIFIEPGRYVVGDAALLISRVVGIKRRSWGDTWIFLNTGFIHLLSGILYKWYFPLINISKIGDEHNYPFRVAGILCDSDDIFHDYMGEKLGYPMLPKYRHLPKNTGPRDVLAFLHVGAYNYEEVSQYNSINRPRIIFISGNNG